MTVVLSGPPQQRDPWLVVDLRDLEGRQFVITINTDPYLAPPAEMRVAEQIANITQVSRLRDGGTTMIESDMGDLVVNQRIGTDRFVEFIPTEDALRLIEHLPQRTVTKADPKDIVWTDEAVARVANSLIDQNIRFSGPTHTGIRVAPGPSFMDAVRIAMNAAIDPEAP